MSQTREQLKKHDEALHRILKQNVFTTEAGKTALLALLDGAALPDGAPKELEKECTILQDFLNHKNEDIRRLSRTAINLAILPLLPGEYGWDLYKQHFTLPGKLFDKLPPQHGLKCVNNIMRELTSLMISQAPPYVDRYKYYNPIGKLTLDEWISFCAATFTNSSLKSLTIGCNLSYYPIEYWKVLCASLERSSLVSLQLDFLFKALPGFNNERWDATEQWALLCDAIQKSAIQSLDLSRCDLDEFSKFVDESGEHWKKLFHAIQYSSFTSLNLSQNFLRQVTAFNKLSPELWNELLSAILQSRITKLNLGSTNLALLGEEQWKAFCEFLTTSSLTSLDLGMCYLGELSTEDWNQFWQAIKSSKLTELKLQSNVLDMNEYTVTDEQWRVMCDAIQHSKLRSFNIGGNFNTKPTPQRWPDFCKAIFSSPITKLDLWSTYLCDLDDQGWNDLCNLIRNPKLQHIDLSENNLEDPTKFTPERCNALSVAIRASNLVSLIISKEHLGRIPTDTWQTLCDAFQHSRLTSLTLLSESWHTNEQVQILKTAISRNFTLIELKWINQDPDILPLLERNRTPYNVVEFCEQLEKGGDATIAIPEILERVALHEKQLESVIKQIIDAGQTPPAIFAEAQEKLMWSTACWLRDRKTVNVLIPPNEEEVSCGSLAIPYFLGIDSTSKYYHEARLQAFELAYAGHHQDVPGRALTALVEALPCLIDENNRLLIFSDAQKRLQIIVDGYLFAAAGIATDSDKVASLTPDDRMTLLQYVLIRSLGAELPAVSTNPSAMYQSRLSGLKQALLSLQPIASFSEIATLTPDIKQMWTKLDAVSTELPKENRLLFDAIKAVVQVKTEVVPEKH